MTLPRVVLTSSRHGIVLGYYALDKPDLFSIVRNIGASNVYRFNEHNFPNEDAARAFRGYPLAQWPGLSALRRDERSDRTFKGEKHRAGLYKCRACEQQFTVTIGSVMESSHILFHKWALAFHLMASSKKGVSANQLMRNLGIGSYRTAWFMAHRIREAMADSDPEPLGGKGKTVEVDETFIGKPDNFRQRQRMAVKARHRDQTQGPHHGRTRGRSISVKVEDLTAQTIKTVSASMSSRQRLSTQTRRSTIKRSVKNLPSMKLLTTARRICRREGETRQRTRLKGIWHFQARHDGRLSALRRKPFTGVFERI